jgi:ferritin
MSLARQNLSKEAEDAINRQILVEFTASYTYLSMSSWLARDTVALHGLAEYYRGESKSVKSP